MYIYNISTFINSLFMIGKHYLFKIKGFKPDNTFLKSCTLYYNIMVANNYTAMG